VEGSLGRVCETVLVDASRGTDIKFVGAVAEPRLDRALIREGKAGFGDPALQFQTFPGPASTRLIAHGVAQEIKRLFLVEKHRQVPLSLPCRWRDLEKIRDVHFFPIRLLFGICAIIGPLALGAAEPAAKSDTTPPAPHSAGTTPAPTPAPPAVAPAPAPTPTSLLPDAGTLALPKVEVTARRTKELDKAIKKLDKAIAREKKNLKATDLDKVLNNPKLASAAAIFGGNSSAYLESVAATRVGYMETERDLLSDMKEPRTLEDLAILQAELDKVREMQRDLDKAITH
jgi:hypothetical protein